MPKCYVVGNIHVTDPEGYQKYASQVQPVTDQFGGKYLVRGGTSTPKDGTPVGSRVVVCEFPDRASAEAWYHSEGYQRIIGDRLAHSTGFLTIVDGLE